MSKEITHTVMEMNEQADLEINDKLSNKENMVAKIVPKDEKENTLFVSARSRNKGDEDFPSFIVSNAFAKSNEIDCERVFQHVIASFVNSPSYSFAFLTAYVDGEKVGKITYYVVAKNYLVNFDTLEEAFEEFTNVVNGFF